MKEEHIYSLAFNIDGRVYLIYRVDSTPITFVNREDSLDVFKLYIDEIVKKEHPVSTKALLALIKLGPHVIQMPITRGGMKQYELARFATCFQSGQGMMNHIGLEVKPTILRLSVMDVALYVMHNYSKLCSRGIPDERNVKVGEEILNSIKF